MELIMDKKPRIGVLGGYRGKSFCEYCLNFNRLELVAVCDYNDNVLNDLRSFFSERKVDVKLVKDFAELLVMNLDGIVIANYANEHAKYAIECLKRNINVLSEVLPAFNLKECVELVEAQENSKAIYFYAENYCYMGISREMKRMNEAGLLGTIEYAEGEYFHNCEPIWPSLAYGDKNHWRNTKHTFYYCTHSLGPIIHATKLRPVKVIGLESPHNNKMKRMGALSAQYGIEMVTLENGAIVKSGHGELQDNSIRFVLCGSLGRVESALENEKRSKNGKANELIYAALSLKEEEATGSVDSYIVPNKFNLQSDNIHYVADVYVMDAFADILYGLKTDYIDVYEAMDMFLPGIFAYKSVLNGGIQMDVPNFRIKEERDRWRNDVSCTSREVAGDQVLPAYSKGNPIIPDEIYEEQKKKYEVQKNEK